MKNSALSGVNLEAFMEKAYGLVKGRTVPGIPYSFFLGGITQDAKFKNL